jgi:predicted metal-dependent hydrolase
LAHLLFEHPELFKNADARVMSLFMWHAAEEIEHKAVPFTVLVNVAKAGYYTRIFVCMLMTPAFFLHTFFLMNKIFKIDGFGIFQRFGLWRRGLPWLFGAGGLLRLMAPEYLKFYRRDFDPWMSGDTTGYERWLEGYSRNHDPIEAGQHALAI